MYRGAQNYRSNYNEVVEIGTDQTYDPAIKIYRKYHQCEKMELYYHNEQWYHHRGQWSHQGDRWYHHRTKGTVTGTKGTITGTKGTVTGTKSTVTGTKGTITEKGIVTGTKGTVMGTNSTITGTNGPIRAANGIITGTKESFYLFADLFKCFLNTRYNITIACVACVTDNRHVVVLYHSQRLSLINYLLTLAHDTPISDLLSFPEDEVEQQTNNGEGYDTSC